jgi:hypothetical protein
VSLADDEVGVCGSTGQVHKVGEVVGVPLARGEVSLLKHLSVQPQRWKRLDLILPSTEHPAGATVLAAQRQCAVSADQQQPRG